MNNEKNRMGGTQPKAIRSTGRKLGGSGLGSFEGQLVYVQICETLRGEQFVIVRAAVRTAEMRLML
jgi:hypothetical protein